MVTAAPGACWLAFDSDSCTIRYAHTPTPAGTLPTSAGTDSETVTPARRAASTSAGTSASSGCGSSSAGSGRSWRSTPRSRRLSRPLGLGLRPGGLSPVRAEHPEQPPHLRHGLARHLAQRAELGAGRL